MRKTTSWIVPSRGWIAKPIWSPFFGLVHVRWAFGGSFSRPYWSISSRTPFFGMLASSHARWAETKASPSTVKRLSSSPSANRSSCQTMPKAARSSSPNLASLAKKRVFSSAWAICHQMAPVALLGLELLPDGSLVVTRGRGDRAEFLLPRHVARADLIEDGGMDGREQTELADLADGNCERGGDGVFGPVFGGEAFDRAPKVDGGHRRADHVFAHRAHMVFVVGVFDQDVDLGESEFDGETDTPVAVDDGECAVFFGHGRRLDDADDLDARRQAPRPTFRRAGFCGGCRGYFAVCGDRRVAVPSEFSWFQLFEDFLEDETGRARAIRPGQRRRVAPGSGPPSEAAGRTHPLRRTGVPCFQSFFLRHQCDFAAQARERRKDRGMLVSDATKVKRVVVELETPDDSRTMFQLGLDDKIIGENLTAVQAHLLVGEILNRILYRDDRRTVVVVPEPLASLLSNYRREKQAPSC